LEVCNAVRPFAKSSKRHARNIIPIGIMKAVLFNKPLLAAKPKIKIMEKPIEN
jgi:hypothetical protein